MTDPLKLIKGKVSLMEPERQEQLINWAAKWMARLEREAVAEKTA